MNLVEKLKLLRTKAEVYANLNNSPEFIKWQEEVVKKRLESYLKKVVSADLDTEAGRQDAINNLKNYQQLQFVCRDIFRVWEYTEKDITKRLNDITPQPDRG